LKEMNIYYSLSLKVFVYIAIITAEMLSTSEVRSVYISSRVKDAAPMMELVADPAHGKNVFVVRPHNVKSAKTPDVVYSVVSRALGYTVTEAAATEAAAADVAATEAAATEAAATEAADVEDGDMEEWFDGDIKSLCDSLIDKLFYQRSINSEEHVLSHYERNPKIMEGGEGTILGFMRGLRTVQ
jgi:hypothetical protein